MCRHVLTDIPVVAHFAQFGAAGSVKTATYLYRDYTTLWASKLPPTSSSPIKIFSETQYVVWKRVAVYRNDCANMVSVNTESDPKSSLFKGRQKAHHPPPTIGICQQLFRASPQEEPSVADFNFRHTQGDECFKIFNWDGLGHPINPNTLGCPLCRQSCCFGVLSQIFKSPQK